MRKLYVVMSAVLFLHPLLVNAQMNLDTVLIRENRIQLPFSQQNRDITLISRKQIEDLPVKSINELLSYVAGVDMRERGLNGIQSDITIDGSSFDEVLVLVDGIKMSDPQTGHNMMNIPVPLAAIDHIEILRGPASAIYGINALAGAINIVTRVPATNEVCAMVYGGSNFMTDTSTGHTYTNWGAAADVALAGKKMGQNFSVAHDEGNGYRYNTDYNNTKLFYENKITLNDKNKLSTLAGYIRNDFGANGFYANPYDNNSHETVQTFVAGVNDLIQVNKDLSLRPGINYRYNNDDYIFIKQDPSYYHNNHTTNVVSADLQSTLKMRNGILGSGIEIRNEEINSNNLGKWHRSNLGIFVEYKFNFTPKWDGNIGLYANYNSDFGFKVYPSFNTGYALSEHWRLIANAGSGQRLPTYTDLYYVGPSNIGNPNLKPEESIFGEGGIKYSRQGIQLSGLVFYRYVSNFIDWVSVNGGTSWQPMNFETIHTKGLTLKFYKDLKELVHSQTVTAFNFNFSYNYLQPDIVLPNDNLSKYSIDALKHQLIMNLKMELWSRLRLSLHSRYEYRINNKDYTLLDAHIAYKMKHCEVYTDLNNLLNVTYSEVGAVPMPGSWYSFGIKLNPTKF
jgi:iron complex outermembrane receptor protein